MAVRKLKNKSILDDIKFKFEELKGWKRGVKTKLKERAEIKKILREEDWVDGNPIVKKHPGRPKGSKNKTYAVPKISKGKVYPEKPYRSYAIPQSKQGKGSKAKANNAVKKKG